MRIEPPWDELDPGIADMVRLLWDAGFQTTDSGDGVSKIGGPMDDGCIVPAPHVSIGVDRDGLFAETDRVIAVINASGRLVDPVGGWHVEGTYTGDGVTMIMVYGPTTAAA